MESTKITHLIRNCAWKFKCNKTWDSLLHAEHYVFEKVRYCPDCKENVHLVRSEKSLLLAIDHNNCVAIPFEITMSYQQMNKPLLGSIQINKDD